MFFQNNKFKKIISTFLIVTFLVPSLFLAQPKQTNASAFADFIGGPANVISQVWNKLQTGYAALSEAYAFALKNKDLILDGIAWTVAKQAVREMTSSIVNWINSGFDGSPAFVTDFEGMMTDIADGVIGEYINKNSKLKFLCSPFSLQLKMSLYNTFYGEEKKYECTLSDAINNAGGALQSLEDDFTWGTWIEMTSKQSNNIYGAFLEVESAILDEILTEQERKKLQADWGKGFLSWETCDEVTVYYPNGSSAQKKGSCTTQTPGSVISDQLNKSLGAGQDSLVTADEINEIIGALLTQIVNKVVGSTGLLKQDTSSYSDYEDLGVLKTQIIEGINNFLKQETQYKNIKEDSLNLIMGAKYKILNLVDCLNTSNESTTQGPFFIGSVEYGLISATDKKILAEEFLNNNTYIPQYTTAIVFPEKIDLKSKEATLKTDLSASNKIISDLNSLITETNNSVTTSELDSVVNKYMKMDIHNTKDISDAEIEKNGYSTNQKIGLDLGLTTNIETLLNIKALSTNNGPSGTTVAPLEEDKGIQQRYDECVTYLKEKQNTVFVPQYIFTPIGGSSSTSTGDPTKGASNTLECYLNISNTAIYKGGTITVNTTSLNADSATMKTETASGTVIDYGDVPTFESYVDIPINETITYKYTVKNSQGSKTCEKTVKVPPSCTLTFSNQNKPINKGDVVTATWTSIDANFAEASTEIKGIVTKTGSIPTSGTDVSLGPINEAIKYTITVTGSGGTDTCTGEVLVIPTCKLNLSNTSLYKGGYFSATWSSFNADSATMSSKELSSGKTTDYGAVSIMDSFSNIGPLNETTIFTFTVKGPGGTNICQEKITVI